MMYHVLLLIGFLAASTSGCAGPTPLPEGEVSLRDLYWRSESPAPSSLQLGQTWAPLLEADRPDELDRALQRDFVSLPNPRLLLYVYPHFSPAGDPIPGYATWFSVFSKNLLTRREGAHE